MLKGVIIYRHKYIFSVFIYVYVFLCLCTQLSGVYGHLWSSEEGLRTPGAALEAVVSCTTVISHTLG